MDYSSFMRIIQSTGKYILSPLLILLGYGVFGALLGYVGGGFTAALLGLLVVYFLFYQKIDLEDGSWHLRETLKMMLVYGVPLSLALVSSAFLTQFYRFLAAAYCSDQMVGNYQAAKNFTILISFFTLPLTWVLFPAFSKLHPEREKEALKTVFQVSTKYASLLVVPVAVLVITVSHPLVYTLFGSEWLLAPLFLSLICIQFLYSGIGKFTLGNLLKGQGKTKQFLLFTLTSLGVGLPVCVFLVPVYGVYGLILATLAAPLPNLILQQWWVKKDYGFTVQYLSSLKIYLASAVAAVATYLFLHQVNFPSWLQLVLGASVFLVVYVVAAPLMGALQKPDIENLKRITDHLGPFTYLIHFLLDITRKIRNLRPH